MIVILRLCFLLIGWLSFGERGGLFEIGCPRSREWKNFGHRWIRGWGSWKLNGIHGRHVLFLKRRYNQMLLQQDNPPKGCQPSHSWAIFCFYPPSPQFVIFKSINYCFEETIGFDVKASFASRPVSRLIRWYIKPGDITKEFWEKAIQFLGTFHGLKITNCPSLLGYFRYPNTNNLHF